MDWYENKRVFITGGSSGIGRSLALAIASAGGHVSIAARGQKRLDEVHAELEARGNGRSHAIALDVSDREAVEAAAAEVVDALGGIDIVIANAGITHPGYIAEIPEDVFQSMIDVNYFGTVNVARAFLPMMRAQKSGHICNVSSTLGFLGAFGYTAYAASKFAIVGFSECLRQEVLLDRITVSVAYPPDTDTPQYHMENEIKPPETAMLSETAGLLTADAVADEILRGIARGKLHITPGLKNKLIRFASFHMPWLVRYVIASDLKKFARKNG